MTIQQLQGTYEVQHSIVYEYDLTSTPIGVGGMGNVYAGTCRNLLTGAVREVAIKKLMSSLPVHIIEKARREASIRIKSDNLVEMIAFVEKESSSTFEESQYYIISELLHCVSLADILKGNFNDFSGCEIGFARELFELKKSNSKDFTVKIITQVLSGLMALHDQGYIHRDIDPTNIVVTNEGHIKLIDFGICKQIGNTTDTEKKGAATIFGTYMGKPEYSAPELANGLIDSHSYSTDIYAVGILMYQCLTGELPFKGSRFYIMQKQGDMKVNIPVRNIRDSNMRAIVRKACKKQQKKRYQSATEMRYDIEKRLNNTNINCYYYMGIAAIIVLGMALCWRLVSQYPPSSDVYTEATIMMDSPDVDSLRAGVCIMDSLAHSGDVDAMYEMSSLYTSYTNDSVIALRQLRLGIDPKNEEAQAIALKWLMEIVHVSDSTHYKAMYSLGTFYAAGRGGLSRDYHKAYRLFELAGRWALKNNDETYATTAVNKMKKCEVKLKTSHI